MIRQTTRNIIPLSLILVVVLSPTISIAQDSEPPAAAPVDSTLIANFLSQPKDILKALEKEAGDLSDQARETVNGTERLQLLAAAANRDPARTHTWLYLAETEMEMGYLGKAEASLASARNTIDFLVGDDRREAIRDYSLGMGWLHFEKGTWDEGIPWSKRAVKYKAGMEGHLVHGLNTASSAKSLSDLKEKAAQPFFPLTMGGNRRANLSWCYLLHFHLNNYSFDGTDAASWLTKTTHHYQRDMSRWRDYGIYCEANHAYQLARSYFEKSFQAIRIKGGGWVTRMDHSIPSASTSPAVMPFWVNRDKGFVTGSLLAYTSFLHDRMMSAESIADRFHWASLIQANANRGSMRYPKWPWISLWQSEALLVLDQPDEAENAIEFAVATFEAVEITEPNLTRVLGHILLLQKHTTRAEPLVRKAVSQFPNNGTCWSDLGLVEVMAGNKPAAREAFDKALDLDPRLAPAWYNRGLMKMHEGMFQEALLDIEQADLLHPGDPAIKALLDQLTRHLAKNKND